MTHGRYGRFPGLIGRSVRKIEDPADKGPTDRRCFEIFEITGIVATFQSIIKSVINYTNVIATCNDCLLLFLYRNDLFNKINYTVSEI